MGITSPPYETDRTVGGGQQTNLRGEQKRGGYNDLAGYGSTPGQIGLLR
uniref:Uncharacterized protein n=1 Tax=viral metagenome TaxID=1070528 RepID=A0A6M3LNJ2_9ZZZZ